MKYLFKKMIIKKISFERKYLRSSLVIITTVLLMKSKKNDTSNASESILKMTNTLSYSISFVLVNYVLRKFLPVFSPYRHFFERSTHIKIEKTFILNLYDVENCSKKQSNQKLLLEMLFELSPLSSSFLFLFCFPN